MGKCFSFRHGLVVSIALHAIPAALFALPAPIPAPKQDQTLVVLLQGEITNRQVEVKQIEERNDPPPPPPPPPREKPKVVPKKAVIPDTPKQEAPSPPSPDQKADMPGNADLQQRQETIRHEDLEREMLKEYARAIQKRMQKHLIFPDEARKMDILTTATITFVVTGNGEIRKETLRVIKSSGFASLDASALSSALASAPFEPPPKEMRIAIPIGFRAQN